MDENASRAVFLGVSVFVAIITITLILTFYRTAKDSASVANRYDITYTENQRADEILSKEKIMGVELRYLLNYYYNNDSVEIAIYQPTEETEENVKVGVDREDYWSKSAQQNLDELIRPNYEYGIEVDVRDDGYVVIVASFEN